MAIVTSGLLGYWNGLQGLNGTAWNNIAPATSGLYNATLTNGAVADSVGGLVSFDGVDDRVSIPTINMNNSTGQEITVELIASFTSLPTNPILISLYNPASTGRFVYISEYLSKLYNQFQSSGLSIFQGSVTMSTNTVYSITLSLNRVGNTFNNYLNGVKSSVTIDPATIFSEIQYGVTLGSFYNGGAYSAFFPGKIYAARIYNRALTDAEVTQNYNNGTAIGLAAPPTGTTYPVSLADTISTSETATPLYTPGVAGTVFPVSLSDAITISETATKTLSGRKSFNDTTTMSETSNKAFSANRTLNDSIIGTESFGKSFSKPLNDIANVTESFSKSTLKNQFDSVSTSDIISKRLTVTVLDTVATSESTGKASPRSLNDTVVSSDSILSTKGKAVNLADSVSIIDAISKSLSIATSDYISTSEVESDKASKTFTEPLSLSDVLLKQNKKNISDSLTASDSVSFQQGKAVNLNDSVSIFDNITKSFIHFQADTINTFEIENENVVKRITDVLTVSDILVTSGDKSVLLSDSVTISDSIGKSALLTKLETLGLTDSSSSKTSINSYDVIISTELFQKTLPNAPTFIGTIKLSASQELYVYLVGSRELNVYLSGTTDLNVNLKGGL